MVQDLLFASILDGHEHLASDLLLLEDLLFSFVQVPFPVFGVVRFRKNVGWLNGLDANPFFFVQDSQLGHVPCYGVEGDCVYIPLEESISPSGVGSFEGL